MAKSLKEIAALPDDLRRAALPATAEQWRERVERVWRRRMR
jgi:hypothetical protein